MNQQQHTQLRSQFPALAQEVNGHPLVYLDNAATTQKPQTVLDAIAHYYRADNANVHRAAHALSGRATRAFEAARETVTRFINAPRSHEVIWTRGTTEAINLVAQSWGMSELKTGDEIILSTLEHHANIVPWQLVAQRTGAVIRVIPLDERGDLDLAAYHAMLGPRTRLVSVAHVSNALGTVNPVKEMVAAAKAAHADSFIRRLPEGYDTVIAEDGGNISQGQKQLLCIARVMLCLPPMLILDEATSSIDTRTEVRIQAAFARMMQGRTSFIVAHRLSTIREADVILVMKDGHIVEQGDHDTLLAQGGFYAKLYNSQFEGVET